MALKKAKTDPVQQMLKTLLDPEAEPDHIKMLLAQICMDDSPHGNKIIQELRALASKNMAEKEVLDKRKQLDEMIKMLHDGPLRLGTYLGRSEAGNGAPSPRAHVLLENGDTAFPAVLDAEMAKNLTCGDAVLLDAQARAIVVQGPPNCLTGEIAELKRRMDDDRVQLMLNDHTSEAYRISQPLKEKLDAGEIEPGAQLVVCTRRRMAFEALPAEEGHAHYKFLETAPVPDVVAERDIGCPPAYIEELVEHVRIEMTEPELGRTYGVRPMQTRLLTGVTGTGKTLSILAAIRGIYEAMSEITAPIEALPPRVLRLRAAHYLSKWLGDSDKLLDRFFDEMEQLANEPFVWDGREWFLPVIGRCEEIDALARARNNSEDIMGRIQTTALERLDHLADELGNKLCIYLFTTNTPAVCDQAFIRRAGGEIINFPRIGRGQLHAILAKKIRGLPLHPELGDDQQRAERQLARDVTNWLFSPNGHDQGQVEVTFAGSATPVVNYRRDVLTGSVVDLSVQQACKEAKRLHVQGASTHGLTTEMLLRAFDRQIGGICDQVTEYNAHNYLPLPDGARVGTVRRIDQPAVQPFELERATS